MWQDALALLIVALAALALLRPYVRLRPFRTGACQKGEVSVASALPHSGCGGCTLGSRCAKPQNRLYPANKQRDEKTFQQTPP